MKKIYLIITAVLLCILVAGCIPISYYSRDPQTSGTPEPSIDVSQTQASTPTPIDNTPFFNEPTTIPSVIVVRVYKARGVLEIYDGETCFGRFAIKIGKAEGAKEQEGDNKTPEGTYYICTRNERSAYTRFMGISYPNKIDAAKALADSLISQGTYNRVVAAIDSGSQPPWDTKLGGNIGIYGKGETMESTGGSIAVSDEDVMILWNLLSIGTEVIIMP